MFHGDTIAAISTPPGRGGIGIIRLSGSEAITISSRIFQGPARAEPHYVRYGHIIDPETREVVDSGLVTCFTAPHSYTGEDVVELSCHGSPVILNRVLRIVLDCGARIAEPGEFTLRAFFNRRIDLAQAQAIRDLIDAQTTYQAKLATRQLEGGLSHRLGPLNQSLIDVIVHLESSVEFVEDDITTETRAALIAKLDELIRELARIADSFSLGRYVREGFDLVVAGRPNVGKSSVFNRLAGVDRAIVTEIPGTTRDALFETTAIQGVPVRLIDTAGIRETGDIVENMGIERSREAIAGADVTLLVLNNAEPLTDDDRMLLDETRRHKRLVLTNKIDLERRLETGFLNGSDEEVIPVSALTGSGFDLLSNTIFTRLSGDSTVERDDIMITDARQHAAIRSAGAQISQARELMEAGELEEILLLKLRGALNSLGEVTGETLTEDILEQIFSTFCIGK